jgi:hypothetical protein
MPSKAAFTNFSQGLISAEEVTENVMPLGSLTHIKNADVTTGEIRTPSSMGYVATLPTGEYVAAVLPDYKSRGHFVAGTRSLFYLREDLTWKQIKSNAFSRKGRPHMVTLNSRLFCCDGVSEPFVFDIDDIEAISQVTIKLPGREDLLNSSSSISSSLSGSEGDVWEKKPIYAYVYERRLWVILKDFNQAWHSVLDDASDFRISAAGAADTANVFVTGDAQNNYVSIIAGLGSLLLFKNQGVDYIRSTSPGSYDAANYILVEGYKQVSSYNAHTTTEILDKIYTIGSFGLQEFDVEPLSQKINLRRKADPISSLIEDAFDTSGRWASLDSAYDSGKLLFDTEYKGERQIYEYSLGKDTIDSNVCFPEARLLGDYITFSNNRAKKCIGYKDQIWVDSGNDGYPVAFDFEVQTPYHPLASGNIFKPREMRVIGSFLEGVSVSTYWDNDPEPIDTIELSGTEYSQSVYDEARYDTARYAQDQHPVDRNTFPLFGQGESLSFSMSLNNISPDVTIKDVIIEYQGVGTKING